MEERLLKYFRDHEAEIFGDLERLVKAEASTSDLEALAETRKVLEALIRERTGEEPLVYEREGGHDLVRFELGQGEEKLLIIGHYDTVHLIGAIQYRTEGDRLYGPGVSDMKSGLISAIWTARAYKELGIDPGRKLVFIFNGDEETGSHESSDIICGLAENARAALVCEPCVGNGDLKTGRKGNIKFNVTIHGKASHAGNAHKEGINAIQEMAAEILKIQALTDYEAGTTVNVGICQGGTKVNVVPAAASFSVDCRYKSMEEGQRIRREILELPISVPGASREVEIVEGKLPMEETQGNHGAVCGCEGMRQEAGTFVFPPVRRRRQRRKRCVSHGNPHPGRPGRLGGRGSFRKRIPADQPVYSADRAAGFADSGYPVEQYRRELLRQGDFEDPLLAAALFLKYRYRSG